MHFYELLQKRVIAPIDEVQRLNKLLKQEICISYGNCVSLHSNINRYFNSLSCSSTFTNFDEMLNELGISKAYSSNNIDDCLIYCEVLLTCLYSLSNNTYIELQGIGKKIVSNIKIILEKTNHQMHLDSTKGFAFITTKNNLTVEAIESTKNEQLALELIDYNRITLKGNVEAKRKVLHLISNHIEPLHKSGVFNGTAYSSLNGDVGFYLNNFNIRHNNVEGKSKQDFLITMPPEKLEAWYDDIYSSFLMLIIAEKQLKIHSNLEHLKSEMKK